MHKAFYWTKQIKKELLFATASWPQQLLTFLCHLSLMLLYLITDENSGCKHVAQGTERNTSQLRSTQECSVDIDGPKQRAEWRDEHLSRKKTETVVQQRRGMYTQSFPKTLPNILQGLQGLAFWLVVGFSHELNMTPRRFVKSRPVCIFNKPVTAVSVCGRFNKPKPEVFEHIYQLGVVSQSFKRVTSIYLVTRRVAGCFGWIVFMSW